MSTMGEALSAAMDKFMDFVADSGTYTPWSGDPVTLDLRLDVHEFSELDDLQTAVSAKEIRIKALIADLGQVPAAKTSNMAGDKFLLNGQEYEVMEIAERDNYFITCTVREL